LSLSHKPKLDIDQLAEGVMRGDRVALGQAITLVESQRLEDQHFTTSLLEKVNHKTGDAFRIAVTGAPGVGKSTFIESFGNIITSQDKRVAVLTIDPTSPISGGSILGDKTRMDTLSQHPLAFIRPTAASYALGGVAPRTREVICLCEAAGYEFIVIETVGVGQSEIAVRTMTDYVLLLLVAGAGDELQGIKRGIMEIADAVLITKADGDNRARALEAQGVFQQALHFLALPASGIKPTVGTVSAFDRESVLEVWGNIQGYQSGAAAYIAQNRHQQDLAWFNEAFVQLMMTDIRGMKNLQSFQTELESAVLQGKITPLKAAYMQRDSYLNGIKNRDVSS
jgi:LAO/AO transport system kinase